MPVSGQVEVDTCRADQVGRSAVVRARLAQVFSEHELFVYEDATHERDISTYLGFGTVVRVDLWGDRFAVSGKPDVVAKVEALLESVAGSAEQRERFDSWAVLDDVLSMFGGPGSSEAFGFGAFCYLGYGATHQHERVARRHHRGEDLPDVSFTICEGHLQIAADGQAEVSVYRSPWWTATLTPSEIVRHARGAECVTVQERRPVVGSPWDEMDRDQFLQRSATCLDFIAAGEAYQVQLGHAISVRSDDAPSVAYQELARVNPSPYMFLWPVHDTTLIGASPESLLQVRGEVMTMRPIAGTCRVTGEQVTDRQAQQAMLADPKELSEHLMLVDLCRNDLARVAEPGSVCVPQYLVVEQYSHVAHLVSAVSAHRKSGIGGFELLRAVYPAGTMTGAPKLRAMEIIDDLELSDRGAYAGAVALVGNGGFVDSALSIRALTHRGDVFVARASAGIVAESDPESEWDETLAKMAGPLSALTRVGGKP